MDSTSSSLAANLTVIFTSGLIAENQLVADGTLHTIQPVLAASPLTVAMDMVRADMVFSDWLDVFERLPEGQTITLWRVIANDDGSLFMHSFVGVIDNERLPRACKIDRKPKRQPKRVDYNQASLF